MSNNQKTGRRERTKQHKARPTIGFLTHGISDEYGTPLWAGVLDAALEMDANLICFPGWDLNSPRGFEIQANVLYDLVCAENVDGLVISGGPMSNFAGLEGFKHFCERYRPLPVVNIAVALEGIPTALIDNYQGVREAMTHLIEVHGYRRIAFIPGPQGNPEAETRYRAYADGLAEHGLPLDLSLVGVPGNFDEASGIAAMRLLLDKRKLSFDAVVATSDGIAIGALSELQARGINVPDDVAVVGFNDAAIAKFATPPLTTVRQPIYEEAHLAVEMVLAQLRGEQLPDQTSLPTNLVVRQSCGCLDPLVVRATAGPMADTGESFDTAFVTRRKMILSEMLQAGGDRSSGTSERMEQLVDAFSVELRGKSSGAFLSTLDRILRQAVMEDNDVTVWQEALSALRFHTRAGLSDGETLLWVENLWQQARLMIGSAAQRAQAYQRLQAEQQAQVLREIGQALITTLDVRELMDVVAAEVLRLNIPGCYLSLYEDPTKPAEWSRLMLACDAKRRVEVEPGGWRFPSRQLLPEELWPRERRFSWVAEPLYFRQDQIGLALFEVGPHEGRVYETLRGEISSALRGALLVQRVEHRAVQLQTAAEVSRAASSILDLEGLSQQVVNVVRERFGLYYVGLFLVDQTGAWTGEVGKWAVLRAGTGEAGRQMLEQGHKLQVGGTSMIGWCIANQQARIALDVGSEAVRFENPYLPETCSELAMPLVSRGQAIGALTIQSAQEAAFSEEDIAVFQTMADQLANAIQNARLYDHAQKEIAERKQMAEALAFERGLLRALMENLPDHIYFKDAESRFIRINKSQADRFGLDDPAQALGKTDFDFFTEEHARPAYEAEQEIIRTGQPVLNLEERETWPSGPDTWVSTTKMPLRDETGNIVGTFGISRDITDRKWVQEALAFERDLLRALMENLPDHIYFKDAESRFIRINKSQADRFGLDDPAQALGKTDFDFFTEEHARPAYEAEQEIIRTGQPVLNLEERETWPSGPDTWVSTTKMPLRDETGNIVGTFGISRDITDRKWAQEALARERNLLRSLIDNVPDYIYVKDTESRFITCNPSLAKLMGVATSDELVGKTDFDFYPPELAAKYYADEQTILQSGQPLLQIEEPVVDAAGNPGWISTTKVPLRDAQGNIFGLVGMGRDITERKRVEMKLQRRAVQLRAAAEVARDATMARDLDELLNRAVNLVCDRFGFYHAGIFLVDEQGEYAILTAATGEAGRAMLEHGYKLKVGEVGIVGYVTSRGQPRIALDVGADAVHFKNPYLPETRSELALPLKVGGRVIGALDVQSQQASAFDEEDVQVLQTMADQLAVAIENVRLVTELQSRLREINILYQSYSQEAWSRIATHDVAVGYEYDRTRLMPLSRRLSPDVVAQLQAGQFVTLEVDQTGDGGRRSTLIAPLMLRGQMIGAVGFEQDDPDRQLSPEDRAVIEAVTSQVALALENARLFEEAQHHAAREQLAAQVTARMRESLDIQRVLQAAVREFGETLGADEVKIRLTLDNQRPAIGG